jgi:hypothetical protein
MRTQRLKSVGCTAIYESYRCTMSIFQVHKQANSLNGMQEQENKVSLATPTFEL